MTTTFDLQSTAERLDADLTALAAFRDDRHAGWTREVFSEPYLDSRGWTRRAMADAGLEVHIDGAGNIIGRLPGLQPELPPLVTGSHTDTVQQGGRFDGMVGVLGAIEFARLLRESGTRLVHDLVVIDFLGEEANEYGISCLGSRSISGLLTPEHLDETDGHRRLGDALSSFGVDPSAAVGGAWQPDSVHAYLELHIEQGPLLERAETQIGVVTAIAGIDRILAKFTGQSGHAGTTPMQDRHDSLVAAANAVLVVDRVGCGAPVHGVSTSGRIESSPGAMNVITNEARLWSEIRSVDATWLTGARRQIVEEITADAQRRGVDVEIEQLTDQEPVPAQGAMQDLVGATAQELGYTWKAVPSGAGHDAAHMARLGPMGMLFVPSRNGLSHCPDEFTDLDDIVRGVDVLGQTLIRLDRVERPAAL